MLGLDQIEKFSEYIFNAGYSSPVRTRAAATSSPPVGS